MNLAIERRIGQDRTKKDSRDLMGWGRFHLESRSFSVPFEVERFFGSFCFHNERLRSRRSGTLSR